MNGIKIETSPMLGVRKIKVKISTEKRGCVFIELSVSDALNLISNISKDVAIIHEKELKDSYIKGGIDTLNNL